jgi:hypothetical protein
MPSWQVLGRPVAFVADGPRTPESSRATGAGLHPVVARQELQRLQAGPEHWRVSGGVAVVAIVCLLLLFEVTQGVLYSIMARKFASKWQAWGKNKTKRPLPVEQPGSAADWLFVGDLRRRVAPCCGEGRCPPGATVLALCPEMLRGPDQQQLRCVSQPPGVR